MTTSGARRAVIAALDRVRVELARQWPTLAGAWSVAFLQQQTQR
jgi:hypothetical protein